MNDCERYIQLISLMLDGELSTEQETELRTHIESCVQCRRAYDAFCGVSESLSAGLEEPPEMLAKGVMFKINMQKKGHRFAFGKFTVLAACLALVLLGSTKLGYFDGGRSSRSISLSEGAATEDALYGAAETSPATQRATKSDSPRKKKLSYDVIKKKGLKLKSGEDGTVYQLGFPIQNVELLNGTKPEEVQKEPAWLLNAKKLQVYKGRWYSDQELADKSRDKNEIKNERIADLTDEDTLDELGELLTSVPDDTTKLTVDSKEFSGSNPIYTLYISAQNTDDPAQTKDNAKSGDGKSVDMKSSEPKVSSFQENLESLKNSLLKKTDDVKASPSANIDTRTNENGNQKFPPSHDLTISVWYVNGEIWCVAVPRDSPESDAAADADNKEKTESDNKAPSDQADKTAKTDASKTDTTTKDQDWKLMCGHILYKAAGSPEKLDALMKKLPDGKKALLTENALKK